MLNDWDALHGEIEVYSLLGEHLRVLDAEGKLKSQQRKEGKLKPNFKEQYLQGNIPFESITKSIHLWHTGNSKESLDDFLGLTKDEMQLFVQGDGSLKRKLDQLKSEKIAGSVKNALKKVMQK